MRILFSLIVLGLIATMAPISAAADTPSNAVLNKVPVLEVNPKDGKLKLQFPKPVEEREVTVDSAVARAQLSGVQRGDMVDVEVDQIDDPKSIKRLVTVYRPVGTWCRIIVLVIAFVIILVAAGIATLPFGKTPRDFVLGSDRRYSNSKCQLALWFAAAIAVYLATLILRVNIWGLDFLYGVDIPANLLALTGLSALTFGGAKAITATKVDNAAKDAVNKTADAAKATVQADAAVAQATQARAAGAPAAVVDAHDHLATTAATVANQLTDEATAARAAKPAAAAPSFFKDLTQNDKGDPDIGDFQMIFITAIAAVTFIIAGYNFLGAIAHSAHVTLPDVDTTLLSGFGLGQGAYLVKKLASKPGEG
jgi:hypothetical protein